MKRKQGKKKEFVTKNKNQKQTKKIFVFIVIALISIVYGQTLKFDFVDIDDANLVYENQLVTDSSVPYIQTFERLLFNVHYKPITFLSWKLEYELFGSDPWHFHLINWLLHLANALLLFYIGLFLFRKIYNNEKWVEFSAFALSLLFALNPLRIESVAWITERKDVLFTFFFLLSWLMYLLYLKQNQRLFLLLGGVAYLFSGLSKSMGLTLIIVIILTDYWFKRKTEIKILAEKIPYLIVFVALLYLYGLIDFSSGARPLVNPVTKTDALNSNISVENIQNLPIVFQWIITASMKFFLWILHSFIPVKISVLYPHNAIYNFFGKMIYIFPVLVVSLLVWAWLKRKKWPEIIWGILFFGFTLAPALMLNATGVFVFLSDRYTYVPSIGLFIFLVVFLNRLPLKNMHQFYITSIIVLLFFMGTIKNIDHWRNSENLFIQALRINPESTLLHLNLGQYYILNSRYDDAIEIYSDGINRELQNSHLLYSNRGTIYLNADQLNAAISDFNKCIEIQPDYIDGLEKRAVAFAKNNQMKQAFQDYSLLINLKPDEGKYYESRGFINVQMGNNSDAFSDLQQAKELGSEIDDSLLNSLENLDIL